MLEISRNEDPHASEQAHTESHSQTLRWVLAHEPPVVFDDAAEHFVDQVRRGTDGALDVELFLGPRYAQSRGEHISRTELVRCVQRGEIELAHCYVAALGAFSDPLWAVELPFLFRDYDHAERVFEGPVGQRLLDGLLPEGLRGLAFAYSGGYRILPTVGRALHTLEDFAGLRCRTSGNPVPQALHAALGGRAVGAPLEDIADLVAADQIEGCEITYVRFVATGLDRVFDTVNETHHSLFTTMTVVNEAWFQGLPERHQAVITEAARSSCRLERQVAIREEQATRQAVAAAGLQIVQLDEAQRERLRGVGRGLHAQFAQRFGADLLEAIETA